MIEIDTKLIATLKEEFEKYENTVYIYERRLITLHDYLLRKNNHVGTWWYNFERQCPTAKDWFNKDGIPIIK
jgi:hypothetical protein